MIKSEIKGKPICTKNEVISTLTFLISYIYICPVRSAHFYNQSSSYPWPQPNITIYMYQKYKS